MPDSLLVVDGSKTCSTCGGHRRKRRHCDDCKHTGFRPVDLSNWWGVPAFLVTGGPSLQQAPIEILRERGIMSLGINNSAGYAPCSAFTFGDGREKFHHALYLDPKVMCFVPDSALRRNIRAKLPDGSFRMIDKRVCDCPMTFGVARSGRFHANSFLTDWRCHWGYGGKHSGSKPHNRLCSTMLGFRILWYLGCKTIYLLGMDLGYEGDGKYAWKEARSGGQGEFLKINSMLHELRPHFEEHGLSVYNCNQNSKCDAFPYKPLFDAYDDCKGAIPPEPLDLDGWYGKGIKHENLNKHPDPISEGELKRHFSEVR